MNVEEARAAWKAAKRELVESKRSRDGVDMAIRDYAAAKEDLRQAIEGAKKQTYDVCIKVETGSPEDPYIENFEVVAGNERAANAKAQRRLAKAVRRLVVTSVEVVPKADARPAGQL